MATQPIIRVVSNPSPRTKKIANRNQRSAQIKVLKGQEREKIHVHLDEIQQISRGQGSKFSFLEFGTDAQAVEGLAHLLGMDDKYSEDVIRRGEEIMREEVGALQKRQGDPQNWFSNPRQEADDSWNWRRLFNHLLFSFVHRIYNKDSPHNQVANF